ncbi:alginate lyase domain containing protein, partial [Rhypophila sp. PSN 637]
MRYWNLQLPIGSPGSPTTISSSSLQGCSGYQNWNYFFSQKADGALVMKVPGSPESAGCVTTPNSKHCRSELRELDPNNGRAASWDPYQPVNRLFARLSCGLTSDGTGTVIGQIKIDDAISTKPVAELYYGQDGSLTMGVGQTRAGGNQVRFPAGNIPLGQVFTYEIRYENNELSGSTPSSVHFFEIRVQHDTKPITPAWPPQGSTGPREGLGPFNIMVQAGHTLTSVPPTTPTSGSSCDLSVPDIASDNTVTLRLFSGSDCCSAVQTIKLGTLDSCHNANADFGSLVEAVGENIFKISNTTEGSNSGGGSTGGSGGECTTPAQPTNDSDNTVAVSLFGDTGCCSAPVETSKIGKFGVCHNANKPFKGTTQTVGQNLFGRNIKIRQYASRDCSDSAWAEINLSNKALCYVGSGQYQSYMIAEGASSGGGGGTSSGGGSTGSGAGSCNSAQPNKKSDTTVVLSLFKESSCCTAIETSAIGKLDVCHKANAPFQAIKQAVGQDMFGRGISIQMFTSDDCSDKAWAQSSLSNKDVCTYGTDKYRSFRIASGSSGGTTPTNPNPPSSCESVTPKPASEDLLQLELYSDDGCCK